MLQRGIATRPSTVERLFARREQPGLDLAEDAEALARACLDMAQRFRSGGRLFVFGNGGASADAQHVAAEFVHPIVGKHALPAIALTNDVATLTGVARRSGFGDVFAHQLRHLADKRDIALGISADGACHNVLFGLRTARSRGLLTVALTGGDGGAIAAEHGIDHVITARSSDPAVVKELHVTTYHVLWEMVQVFVEQPKPSW